MPNSDLVSEVLSGLLEPVVLGSFLLGFDTLGSRLLGNLFLGSFSLGFDTLGSRLLLGSFLLESDLLGLFLSGYD